MNRMTADEIIEVVTAYKNGADIEWTTIGSDVWETCMGCPTWNFNFTCYRVVKPKPKTKTVKFLGLMDKHGYFVFVDSSKPTPSDWKRVPSADCEHEVEE